MPRVISFIRPIQADLRMRRRAGRPVDPENLEFSFPHFLSDARAARNRFRELFNTESAVAQARSIRAESIPSGEAWRRPDDATFAVPLISPRQTRDWLNRRPEMAESVYLLQSQRELPALGKACFLTSEALYGESLLARFYAWREANPPFRGPAWSDPCEAACRLMNWIWGFSFLRGAEAFNRDVQRDVLESVYRHGEFIELGLALEGDPARRIAAAAGLAVAGAHFCLADRAEEWSERGFAAMTDGALRWLPRFRASGDRAAIRRTLEIIIPAYAIAKSKRVPLRVSFLREIEECAMDLLSADDEPAFRADASARPAPRLQFAAAPDPRRHIGNSLALIGRNAELKKKCAPLDEQTFWIFGPQGCSAYDAIA